MARWLKRLLGRSQGSLGQVSTSTLRRIRREKHENQLKELSGKEAFFLALGTIRK